MKSKITIRQAAELLGINYQAMRMRVQRQLVDGGAGDLPPAEKISNEYGRDLWAWDRREFMRYVKWKNKERKK